MIAVVAFAIIQPAQAGKFKDFFIAKKDSIAKAFKTEKKQDSQNKPNEAKKAPPTVVVEKKSPVQQAMPVKEKVVATPAPNLPSLGRVPQMAISSFWTKGSDRAAFINSEEELDKVALLDKDDATENKKITVKTEPKNTKPAKSSNTTMQAKTKESKKGNWFKRMLNRKNDPMK